MFEQIQLLWLDLFMCSCCVQLKGCVRRDCLCGLRSSVLLCMPTRSKTFSSPCLSSVSLSISSENKPVCSFPSSRGSQFLCGNNMWLTPLPPLQKWRLSACVADSSCVLLFEQLIFHCLSFVFGLPILPFAASALIEIYSHIRGLIWRSSIVKGPDSIRDEAFAVYFPVIFFQQNAF